MVVLHELSHVVVMLLAGLGFDSFKIEGKWFEVDKEDRPSVVVYSKTVKTKRIQFFVSYSPIILFVIFLGLSFISNFFLGLTIYALISFKATLPSETDVDNHKNFITKLYGDVYGSEDCECIA